MALPWSADIQLGDDIVMGIMGQEEELLFGRRSTMHHDIAVVGGHHQHLIGGMHDLELTNLGQTAGLSWT